MASDGAEEILRLGGGGGGEGGKYDAVFDVTGGQDAVASESSIRADG